MPGTSEAFRRNYLVHGLSGEAVDRIGKLATEEYYLAGETVIRAGERNADLFIVLEGTAYSVIGKADLLHEIGPGGVFGEIALIDDQPRLVDTVCKTRLRVAKVPAKALRQIMLEDPEVGFVMLVNLSRVLCQRLRLACQKVDSLSTSAGDPWVGQI